MRKDRIAEWLLESVTTRQRAASTVGDLRESAAARGEAWFWLSVLGTAASLSRRGVADDPRGMLGLAFRGLLLAFLMQICLVFVTSAAVLAYKLLTSQTSSMGVVAGSLPFWNRSAWLCAEFFVGRWMAHRAPGRELAAWLTLAILQFLIMLALLLATGSRESANWSGILLMTISCCLGALSVRRTSIHA